MLFYFNLLPLYGRLSEWFILTGRAAIRIFGFYVYAAGLELQPGCSVTGAIDGKFDSGYLVTVKVGSQRLKGVLYHIPLNTSKSSYSLDMHNRRNRKKSRLALRDPSRPKSNRSGYNFFFAEHYARLKPMYYGQEKAISKKIGVLWNNLTEAEKQVFCHGHSIYN